MSKAIVGKLLGALLLVGSTVLISPSDGKAQTCCTCDFSQCYHYCYSFECGTPQSCQACHEMCSQAEADCAENCPGPIC